MTSQTTTMLKHCEVGLLEVSWRWLRSDDGPRLEGYVNAEEDGLGFSLSQSNAQAGFLLKVPSGTQSLALSLLQQGSKEWLFSASYIAADAFIQSGWGPLLTLSGNQMVPPRSGELQVPTPWQGQWSLWRHGSASPVIDITLTAPGMRLDTASLGGSSTEWATNLPAPFSRSECAYRLDIGRDGAYHCSANLPLLPGSFITQQLDSWPPTAPPKPTPTPPAEAMQQPVESQVSGLAPFRQLGFLTLLVPPAADTQAPALLRLLALANTSSFYQQLLSTADEHSLEPLQQLANAFFTNQAPWEGQFVADLDTLPAPFTCLSSPEADAVLVQPLSNRDALIAALTQLFGMPPDDVLSLPAFAIQWQRLANSYLSLLVLDYSQSPALNDLLRGLRVLALVQGLTTSPQALLTGAQISAAQHAQAQLPTPVFPLPQGQTMQAPPGLLLGAGQLYQFAERVCGYALGSIAEAINLLPGEQLGKRVSRQTSLSERQHDATQVHTEQQQHSTTQQQLLDQPQLVTRTQFNDLAEQYGADGLSVTVNGNYLVAPGTLDGADFQPVQQARTEVQQLFERALSQTQHTLRTRRERLLRSAWKSSSWQRLNNLGEQARRGFYHWLVEQRDARLRDLGPRLLFHWTLDNPGQVLLAALNAQYGQRQTIPAPPWVTTDTVPGVSSPAELNQQNYLALAQRYNLQRLLTAPQKTLRISQDLSSTPPKTCGTLTIPPGYQSNSLQFAAASGSSGSLLIAGKALTLDTPQPVELIGLSGEVPFTLVTASDALAISLQLTCSAQHYAVQRTDWQTQAYNQLLEAYQEALVELATTLQRFCAEQPGGVAGCLVNRLQGTILQAVQSHYPDSHDLNLRRAQQLQPWLCRALPWQQAILAYASATQPADWLPLHSELNRPQAGIALLQAAQLRMTLALDNTSAARLFYLLRSGGRLWLGDDAQVPVFAEDAALYNLWQDLHTQLPAQDQCWRFNVETCHRYLAEQLELQSSCSAP